MGLLDGTTQQQYYQGNDLGNYQFTSLEDIVNQFMVVYVGDNKVIPKASRIDVAFHAQRALQELSFDTFKSIKSQQIDLPPTLVMPLPHDYVNYTRVMWADSSGIKHPIYPTRDTQNPFQIKQEDDGQYEFNVLQEVVLNGDFTENQGGYYTDNWMGLGYSTYSTSTFNYTGSSWPMIPYSTLGHHEVIGGVFTFRHRNGIDANGAINSTNSAIYQQIDVTDQEVIALSADGQAVNTAAGTAGVLRIGLSTSPPHHDSRRVIPTSGGSSTIYNTSSIFDLVDENGNPSYLEWTVASGNTLSRELTGIDISNINTVYVIVTSKHEYTSTQEYTMEDTNNITNISMRSGTANSILISPEGNSKNSSTWNNYKSLTPSENNNDDYEDDTYWPANGERYGLDPSHAQINGSFFIDQRLGRIHFSSNISGKTVILDYISDSLGTDAEMKVHKLAEEAMYKSIAHAVLSTSAYGQALVPRLTKEKFAAVRKAKLRLSNIKLEELTQILRGKSKQIKH